MRGETVVVLRPNQTGTDPGGGPIYGDPIEETVEDVLVAPGPLADVIDSTRPEGVRVAYNLHFPKTFSGSLRGCEVRVRGSEELPVIGDPKPYTLENTPTRWWMPVELEAVHG